ncbi:hypothetical protein Shyhy01_19960 [Streptomyces hygroscopicus subsp. hygroscopicus]|nr:hypothetical protein [Streptomyces hygroscopicus]GLX49046.1 hypothetical protein Shyhy01_19960 [Streptomyces hygroscopicus subsp. hygroscopicus]
MERPSLSEAASAGEHTNTTLRHGTRPAEVPQRFVDTLDAEEQAALRALLGPRG